MKKSIMGFVAGLLAVVLVGHALGQVGPMSGTVGGYATSPAICEARTWCDDCTVRVATIDGELTCVAVKGGTDEIHFKTCKYDLGNASPCQQGAMQDGFTCPPGTKWTCNSPTNGQCDFSSCNCNAEGGGTATGNLTFNTCT
jgi:hypothetical protein